MEKLLIRKAQPIDLERLLPLVADYHAFEGLKTTAAHRRRTLTELLRDPSMGIVWCVEDATELIGYLAFCYGYSLEFGGRDAFIDEFFLVPGARGRGLGANVLDQVISEAAAGGTVALHLEVAGHNVTALRLYERRGFSPRVGYEMLTLEMLQP